MRIRLGLFGSILHLFNAKFCSYILYIYIYIGWNDKVVAQEKTTWFHFRLKKNRFSFFVADHLLVGQLCTNPKIDRSLLSCLKVIQCSTSEIGDVPLYNSCTLPIQVMTTGPLPAPLKCKSGLLRITGTCPGWWKTKFPAMVMVFGVVSSEGHIMPPDIFKVAWKSTPKCTWMCWRVWWNQFYSLIYS